MTITEIKRHLDGREERFDCDLLHRAPGLIVVEFVPAPDSPFFGRMSRSEGYFWAGRPYLMYRIFAVDGTLAGYRFDACRDVRLGHDFVEFTDLLLDFRVSSDGVFTVEDEDELEAALALGVLEEADYDLAQLARELVETGFAALLEEIEELSAWDDK
ncbi:MAG: DUF402 domain-containing protein [Dehalococcoidia bacterium]|nr:DUF402 domain-containing protein [Dehalococcoidia bacterium]